MIEVTAKYLERKVYEIEVEGVRELFVEPSFAIASEYTYEIVRIVEELNIKGIDVREEQIWLALSDAAENAGRKFPNFLRIGNVLF